MCSLRKLADAASPASTTPADRPCPDDKYTAFNKNNRRKSSSQLREELDLVVNAKSEEFAGRTLASAAYADTVSQCRRFIKEEKINPARRLLSRLCVPSTDPNYDVYKELVKLIKFPLL